MAREEPRSSEEAAPVSDPPVPSEAGQAPEASLTISQCNSSFTNCPSQSLRLYVRGRSQWPI